jgi:hypothetical protein
MKTMTSPITSGTGRTTYEIIPKYAGGLDWIWSTSVKKTMVAKLTLAIAAPARLMGL